MSYQPFPIGIDDFKKLRENHYYYVDKSWMIKELLDKKGEINLFTRPRRFGKTLNLSMLRYFFEKPLDNKTNRTLFENLKITQSGEKYSSQQEQYPIINLTLKSAKQKNFDNAYVCLVEAIANEFQRHMIIQEHLILKADRDKFYRLMSRTGSEGEYLTSLAFLSKCLHEYYQHKVIILIDEYDVPLENAYYAGFYEKMLAFIRSLFESSMKSNPFLEFAVITGCLRISKESIFTGLNNLKIISILNEDYGEHFGFTKMEVQKMLADYHCEAKHKTIKQWYDGYLFGKTEVYNPWSVLNYVESVCGNDNAFPIAAWSNTSSNSIVRDLIYQAHESVKQEIETLVNGGTIEKVIHEEITYDDIYTSADNLWNFLFFTGYLKMISMRMEGINRCVTMAIPNNEVLYIYENTITNWFRDEIKVQNLAPLYNGMLSGQDEVFQKELSRQLQKMISYMDGKEAFYHGFLLGILANLDSYIIKSNREAGNGRYDICVCSTDVSKPVIIMELKVAPKYKELEMSCHKAIQQILDQQYAAELAEDGYRQAILYGIGFYKKQVLVKMKRLELDTI